MKDEQRNAYLANGGEVLNDNALMRALEASLDVVVETKEDMMKEYVGGIILPVKEENKGKPDLAYRFGLWLGL